MTDFRCHWTHAHDRHTWAPLLVDPNEPRVLHLTGETVTCPGRTAAEAEPYRGDYP